MKENKPKVTFPPFDLIRLLHTVFFPKNGEKLAILIDLENPFDVVNFSYLNHPDLEVQKKAYHVFYQGLNHGGKEKLKLGKCDFFAYQITGGSNLELPDTAVSSDGITHNMAKEIYSLYDIILCITTYSATAPLTASAKKFNFRGTTMHGLNDIILNSGLAVDYNVVSKNTEKLRKGLTKASEIEIEFQVKEKPYFLKIDLQEQEAQKSHGICHVAPDVVNLPAGEVYFVPTNAKGEFPIKFEDGTLGLFKVEKARVTEASLIEGNPGVIQEFKHKLASDPFTGVLGELGFGTQVLPYSGADIQDEKIFGTFHLATGRNDHLNGNVTLDKFKNYKNATHDDILFSSTKTPEIIIKEVRMLRNRENFSLIKNYEPQQYLWNLLDGS